MATLLVLTRHERAKTLIKWTALLAEGRSGPLMILCCFSGRPILEMVAVTPERLVNVEGLLRTARTCLNDLGLSKVEIWELRHPDRAGAILSEIEKHKIDLLVLETDGRKGPGDPETHLGNRMLRFAPTNVMLIDPGEEDGEEVERIIVPIESSFAPDVLKVASGLVSQNGVVVPLMVGPEFGSDSRAVARRELNQKLQEMETTESREFVPEVAVANRLLEGIAKASRNCDMVLIGASSDKVLFKLRSKQAEIDAETKGRESAIGLFRPAREKGLKSVLHRKTLQWLPQLSPTDRVNMFDRLQAGARFNPDFLIMMGLATAIASLGLLQGSAAVVIGAMLVAPLMTPLIGAGFSLVQGNIRLFRKSMLAMVMGIAFGLVLSIIIDLLVPERRLSMEILARVSPDVLDFFVALLSGMAAAYAFARPSLMGTLAGVAIAAALVPPLAVAGIGLSRGMLEVAESAAILHVTNLAAITLGGAIIFRLLGVQGVRLGIGPSLWSRRAILTLSLFVIMLMAPLGYKMADKLAQGQPRPIYFPLSKKLTISLLDRVEQESEVDMIMGGRSSFAESGNKVLLILASQGAISMTMKMDMRQIVKGELGGDTKVVIYALQESAVDKGK